MAVTVFFSLPTSDPRYIVIPDTGDFVISGISTATEEADSGLYACTATNGASTATDYAVCELTVGQKLVGMVISWMGGDC